jgi:hypothetical protein
MIIKLQIYFIFKNTFKNLIKNLYYLLKNMNNIKKDIKKNKNILNMKDKNGLNLIMIK